MEISSVKDMDPIVTDTHRVSHVLVSWSKDLDESTWIVLTIDSFLRRGKCFLSIIIDQCVRTGSGSNSWTYRSMSLIDHLHITFLFPGPDFAHSIFDNKKPSREGFLC